MPTQTEIRNAVVAEVAIAATIAASQITDTMVLTGPPLKIDATNLTNLAARLRVYVKAHAPGESIYAREVKKSGLTVGALVKLVAERVQ